MSSTFFSVWLRNLGNPFPGRHRLGDLKMTGLILLVFAFVVTIVEAFYSSWPRPHLGWLGLALYFLSLLLHTVSIP